MDTIKFHGTFWFQKCYFRLFLINKQFCIPLCDLCNAFQMEKSTRIKGQINRMKGKITITSTKHNSSFKFIQNKTRISTGNGMIVLVKLFEILELKPEKNPTTHQELCIFIMKDSWRKLIPVESLDLSEIPKVN